MYSNDSLGIVIWDHRPGERFVPHGKLCDILRAAIKSRFSAVMFSVTAHVIFCQYIFNISFVRPTYM